MPKTPERARDELVAEQLQLTESTAPTETGEFRLVSGELFARDSAGSFNLRSGGGISEAQHRTLRQLIHFIEEGPAGGFASGAYKETLPSGSPFPTSVIWWESSSKLKKIVERSITWTGANPTTDQWEVYDTDGSTVLATVTDTISYSGPFETTRSRVITVA